MTNTINATTNSNFPYALSSGILGAIAGGVVGYKKKVYLEDGKLSDVFINSVKQTMPEEVQGSLEQIVDTRLPEAIGENRYYKEKIPNRTALSDFVQNVQREYTPQGIFIKIKQEINQKAKKPINWMFFNKLNSHEKQFVEQFIATPSADEAYLLVQTLSDKQKKTLSRKLGNGFKIFCSQSAQLAGEEIQNIGLLSFKDYIDKELSLMEKLFKGTKTAAESSMLGKIDINNPISFAETIVNDFLGIADRTRNKIIASHYNSSTGTFENTADSLGSFIKRAAAKAQAKNTFTYGAIGAAILAATGYLIGDYIKNKPQDKIKSGKAPSQAA